MLNQQPPALASVENLAEEKFLSLQRLTYENGVQWTRATRDSSTELNRELKPSSVQVLVWDNEGYTLLTREFRYSLNQWVVGTVAGMVDEGESVLEAARRELREEAGLDVPLEELQEAVSYLPSAGLTDEMTAVVGVMLSKPREDYMVGQELEGSELIETFWCHVDDDPRDSSLMAVSAFLAFALF